MEVQLLAKIKLFNQVHQKEELGGHNHSLNYLVFLVRVNRLNQMHNNQAKKGGFQTILRTIRMQLEEPNNNLHMEVLSKEKSLFKKTKINITSMLMVNYQVVEEVPWPVGSMF